MSVLSIGCYVCWAIALFVDFLSCRSLKVAFGHLFLNDPGVLVCVVNWMLRLSVACYSCVLHACLVFFEGGLWPPFSWGSCLCCQLDATLVRWVLPSSFAGLSCGFLKVAFGHIFLNDPGVHVCVVDWMLLLSVG